MRVALQTAMATARFSFPVDHLKSLATDALAHARSLGATAAEAEASEGYGLSVTARMGEVETIEHNRDKSFSVTVYIGTRKGYASSSDFSTAAVRSAVEAARNIARFTAEDDCAGLADPALLARDWADPDLLHPWEIDVPAAIDLARRTEAAALAVSPMIRNSEGASVSAQHSQFAYANSHGFVGGYPSSRHYVSCSVIAAKSARAKNAMQRDDWYAGGRDARDFPAVERIGDYAARRALARLGAKRISTRQCPVLFEAPLATGLTGALVSAASGGSLYRKASFLLDALGREIFAPHIDISEDPTTKNGLASGPFDNEGVATHARKVVERGVLKGYFLSTYSARKLGMQSTGNAGGAANLTMHATGNEDFVGMLRRLGTGLLVTDLMGHGLNTVTGDYSRGAAGYWVEGGEIVAPVEEITIAGNMKDMFRGIVAVGADAITRGSVTTGSVLIDRMTIAGA
ncbi:MAG: metalloprotease PmbA [Burkholderiales bacterium]|nr:metalloprotease PmbA [Burkholderiales bacterium]